MDLPAPRPSWVGAAALTVVSSGAVAALVLVSTPAPAPTTRMVATTQQAPVPVSLSFPAPVPAAPLIPAPEPTPVRAVPAPPQPAPAAAARPANSMCEGDGWRARRGEAAVNRLHRPADARAVPVTFRSARPDVLGLADLAGRRVDVFVRSCEKQSDALVLHVLAHELGHVLDVSRMTDQLRVEWMAARGIPTGTPWFGCDRCTDFATPAGDFAETYAQWQRGASSSRSELAPPASQPQLEQFAERFFLPLLP